MKGLNLLFAFLGGAAVGAAAGILFAPEKKGSIPERAFVNYFTTKESN